MADETENLNINIGSDPSGVEQGSKRATTSIRNVNREAKELDTAFRRLKSSIDPAFAATERYNKTLADNQRLLAAGRISQDEYAAGARAAKAALDAQIESINRSSQSAKIAAAQARQQAAQQKAEARSVAEAERQAARIATAEKVRAAREAAAAVEAAQRREQAAMRLSAQTARQAALEARKLAQTASSPNTRGVAPGSIATDQSAAQLAYARQRAEEAAARAAQRAWDLAARAAEASSQRAAASLQAQAQRARQVAEDYSNRATQLARTQASVEGAAAQQAANAIRAAKEAEREAIRAAAAEAKAAATQKRIANKLAADAARQSAEATRLQAAAEREANASAQQLRASIDPVFASQQRYNQVMQQATQLLMQNKLSQGEWTRIQKQAKAQMDVNVRSLGQMNSMYVQLGYQAQDVTASLASGINPLVILAQQGGQTAAALAGMGGTVGKVAAFMAGPWGAAIIGFTLLIGLMMGKTKEAEKATLDLTNAEKARRAKLEDLTRALEDFNKEQERANVNNREALEIDKQRASIGLAEAQNRVNLALEELAAARAAERAAAKDQASATGRGLDAAAGAYAAAKARLTQAQETLKAAQAAYGLARQAQQQVEIRAIRGNAEAATDPRAAIRNAYEDEETRLQRIYEKETKGLDPVKQKNALLKAQKRLQDGLEAAMKKRIADEQRLTEQTRHTTSAARTGTPREDARRAADYARAQGFTVGKVGPNGVSKGAGHREYRGVDINAVSGVDANDPTAKARLDKLALEYQKMGYTVLWNGKRYDAKGGITLIAKGDHQHKDHLHVEAPREGALVKGASEAANDALDSQVDARQQFQEEMERVLKDVLDTEVENIEYRQQAAEDDYEEQLRLQDEKINLLTAFHGKESKEVVRAHRERLAIEKRNQQEILRNKREEIEYRAALAQEAERVSAEIASIDRGQRGDNVDFNSQNGLTNEREALIEQARLMDEEYASNIAHEQRLFQLRAQAMRDQLALANLPVEQRKQILTQLEQLETEHHGRMAVMNRQYARDVNGVANQAASLQAQKWREVASTLTQSLGSAFQGLWTKSMTFKEAMIQVADQLVYKFFDMGLKIVENWIVAQFTKKAVTTATTAAETSAVIAGQAAQTAAVVGGTITETGAVAAAGAAEVGIVGATVGAKVAGEAIKTGATISGAAASTAANATAGMINITTSAAESAAGAFKSTVVIPFIGPVAAPVAAGLALATVLGFGALISARGGQSKVPYDGQLTELHKDEMVLPAWLANPLRDSLAGIGPRNTAGSVGIASLASMSSSSSTSKADAHFYYQPSYTSQGNERLGDMLRKDGRDMKKWVKNQIRNNRLNLGEI